MRVVGIICEYNPFHRGHLYHLETARRLADADHIVCVMSGPFTQRGLPARHDKWTRARSALMGGADLVLELPVRFACAPAPDFARGGIELLSALGVVTHLAFGCEPEAARVLPLISRITRDESGEFRHTLQTALDQGMGYPAAYQRACAAACPGLPPEAVPALSAPNATLGLEYLRHLPEDILPVIVPRMGSGYHDRTLGSLSSASAIRTALETDQTEAALGALPFPELFRQAEAEGHVHEPGALSQLILWKLRTAPVRELSGIFGMREGLEHRFAQAAREAVSLPDLLAKLRTKRYTDASLCRIAAAAALGMTGEFAGRLSHPDHIRVLGFRDSALPLLSRIKKTASLPLITKTAGHALPGLEADIAAQDLWALGCRGEGFRTCGRDYTVSPVRIP